jgi:uncharacterized protein YaaN involved in tellurite resistance
MTIQTQKVAPLAIANESDVAKELGLIPITQNDTTALATAVVNPALEAVADRWVKNLMQVDPNSADSLHHVNSAVENIGADVQGRLARKSSMLKEQMAVLAGTVDGDPVAKSLIGLKVQVDKINPNNFKLLDPGSLGRMFAWIPGVGTTLNQYFTRWQSAGGVIESITINLKEGVGRLQRDIDVLQGDQIDMRALTLRLQQTIQVAMLLDQKLVKEIEAMSSDDPRRKIMEEEVLFALRQKTSDLLQNLAVNQQGVLTYEIIIRNNRELIRGARRCETVTLKALEIAVVAALALARQRVVLRTIQAIDTTTQSLLIQNARTLRTQGTEIHKQASGQSVSIEALRTCFVDITGALDEIARFKQEALPQMAERIIEGDRMAGEVNKRIIQMERGNASRPTLTLDLDITGT